MNFWDWLEQFFIPDAELERRARERESARARKILPPPRECPKCGEDHWVFVSLSFSKKAAIYKCAFCKKRVIVRHQKLEREAGADAILALQTLGYTRKASKSAVQKALAELKEGASVEDIVHVALGFPRK